MPCILNIILYMLYVYIYRLVHIYKCPKTYGKLCYPLCVQASDVASESAKKPSKEPAAAAVQQRPSLNGQALKQGLASEAEDLNRKAVKKRLARMFAPRVDGTYLVPEELVQQYKDLSLREGLVDDFIASGLSKDCPGEHHSLLCHVIFFLRYHVYIYIQVYIQQIGSILHILHIQ